MLRSLPSSKQLTAGFLKQLDELLPSDTDSQALNKWAVQFKDWDYLLEIKEIEQKAKPSPASTDLQQAKELFEKKIPGGPSNLNEALKKVKEEHENLQLLELAIKIEAANQGSAIQKDFLHVKTQELLRVKFIDEPQVFIDAIIENIKQNKKLKMEENGRKANKSPAEIKSKVDEALQEMVSSDDIVAEIDQSIDEGFSHSKLAALYKRLSLFKKILADASKGEWNQKNLNFIDQVCVAVGYRLIKAVSFQVEKDAEKEITTALGQNEIKSSAERLAWARAKTDAEIKLFIKMKENEIDQRSDLVATRKEQMKKRLPISEEEKKIDAEVASLKNIWKSELIEKKAVQDDKEADAKISEFISQKRKEKKEGVSTNEIKDALYTKLRQEIFKDAEDKLSLKLALNEQKRYVELRTKREEAEVVENLEKESAILYEKLKQQIKKTPYSEAIARLQTVRVNSKNVRDRYAKLAEPTSLTKLQAACESDIKYYEKQILNMSREDKRNYNFKLAVDKYKAHKDMHKALRDQDEKTKESRTKLQRYEDFQKQLIAHKGTLIRHRDDPYRALKQGAAIFGIAIFTGLLGLLPFLSSKVRARFFNSHGAETVSKLEKTLPVKPTEEERIRQIARDVRRRYGSVADAASKPSSSRRRR